MAGLRLLQSHVALGSTSPEHALDLAEQGIAELETHSDDDLAWRLQWRKADGLRALNRIDDAFVSVTDAATAIDSLRKSPLGYRLDSTSRRNKLPPIEEAIAFAADTGHATDCLRFIELVKSRALASALSMPPSTRTSRTPLEIEFDDVTRQLDAVEYSGYSGALDGAIVRTERAALLARRVALLEQIRLRDPRLRGLSTPPPFDTERFAAPLEERYQAAATLHTHDSVVRSVLVIEDGIEVGHCMVDASVITTLADYAANLVRPTPDPYSLDPADPNLDATMFVPQDLPRQSTKSRIGSDCAPWPASPVAVVLVTVQRQTPVRAHGYRHGTQPDVRSHSMACGRRHRVQRSPASERTGLPPNQGFALHRRRTAQLDHFIRHPFDGAAPIDAAATEAAVKALAAREDATGAILHLSCHGTLSIEEPLASGVLLRDGRIDAAEWAQMRVHYDEVVLSACSTGWRPMTAQGVALEGDDILGLPGALLEAGARAIIVSIPKADDKATAAFMTAYHRHRGDSSPLAAFNQTQREMLASANEPYTWSGLVCYGVR